MRDAEWLLDVLPFVVGYFLIIAAFVWMCRDNDDDRW